MVYSIDTNEDITTDTNTNKNNKIPLSVKKTEGPHTKYKILESRREVQIKETGKRKTTKILTAHLPPHHSELFDDLIITTFSSVFDIIFLIFR